MVTAIVDRHHTRLSRRASAHLEDAKRRTIRIVRLQHGVRDIEDRNAGMRLSLRRPLVRMALKNGRDLKPRERILETARAEEREDLQRLALDRVANRRIVHEHDPLRRFQSRERGLELERFLDRLVHEVLDDLLTPRPERAAAEAAAESAHAGEPHVAEFPAV